MAEGKRGSGISHHRHRRRVLQMGLAPQWSIHSTLLLCLQRMVGLCERHIRSTGGSDDNNDEDPYRDAAPLLFRSLGWNDYQAAILAFLNVK